MPHINVSRLAFAAEVNEADADVVFDLKPSNLTDDFVAHEGEDDEDDGK